MGTVAEYVELADKVKKDASIKSLAVKKRISGYAAKPENTALAVGISDFQYQEC